MDILRYSSCFMVLLLTIANGHGHVMKDLMTSITNGHEKDTCGIDDAGNNITCSTLDGDLLILKEGDRIPPLSMCYGTGAYRDENSFLCLANGVRIEDSFALRKTTRHKRFLAIFSAVVSVIGLVTDVICMFVCNDDRPPPHQPPKLLCATPTSPQPVVAGRGEDTAVVNWAQPTATDMDGNRVSIQHQPSSYHSGQRFSAGNYAISFLAVDSASASASCVMEFEVKVIHCGRAQQPLNGMLSYDGYSYGKTCTVTCLHGYHLRTGESPTVTCERYGGWSRNPPNCEPNFCKTVPNINNGIINCPENKLVFGNICTIKCEDGYKLEGPYYISCDENGNWGPAGTCKDAVAPMFNMRTCPDNLVFNIDSPNNTALVKWTIPEGFDNSLQPPIIREINDYTPNSRFVAGTYLIRYSIEDSEGNVGQSCVFQLRVQTIYCEPPSLAVEGASHMVYTCPERYRFGAECTLSCKSGYPLGGINKIQCANIDEEADPPVLDWRWPKDALHPYCKESVCPDLRSPVNGATACDLWTYGRQCQIQCQKDFDFAYQFPEMYVCGTNTGLWKPMDIVPDCTRKISPRQAHLMSDVYYYTGQCNSSKANLHEIQTNFIKALNSSTLNAVCLGEPFCKAEFVNVSCGAITTRRRRDTHHHDIQQRSAYSYAYVVQFELILAFSSNGVKSDFASKAGMLQQMANVIQSEMDNGHFDMNSSDMHIEFDSFGPGAPSFKCPIGTKTRLQTGSCAGCPVGMFMSEDTSTCKVCPFGTYQETINSIGCKACPQGTNTTNERSTNASQCKAYCAPGSYSDTGLAPCTKCPATHYQPMEGQKLCLHCGALKRALDVGSTVATECKAFDVLISKGKGIVIDNITSTASSLTIVSWLLVKSVKETVTLFSLDSPGSYFSLKLQKSGALVFDFKSMLSNTSVHLKKNAWLHLSLTFDSSSKDVKLYQDGREVYNQALTFSVVKTILENSWNFTINADVQLSSFHILDTSLSAASIQQLSKSCLQLINGSIASLDDIKLQRDAQLIIPSQCDDLDECSSNPCGVHECENKLGGFECVCSLGYTGTLCNISPDFCNEESCLNGATCLTGKSNYTCSCQNGFRGTHCEIQATNGGWSDWTDWTLCSKTCGSGVAVRHRQCDSPPPDTDGQPCIGPDRETQTCNTEQCPECPPLRRTFGLLIHCNDTKSSKRCTLSCRPGLYFASPPLLLYECGRISGYKWNHQTSENPSARLPTCSNVKPPEKISVGFEGEYNINPCDTSAVSSLTAALETKLQTTTCVQSSGCHHTISSTTCHFQNRKRRSTPTTTAISISLSLDVKPNNLASTLESLLVNKTVHSGLLKLMKSVNDLEKTAQEIYNNSVKFLQVTIGGKSLSPLQTMPLPITTVVCPPGSVKLDIFCAVAPQGSFTKGSSVILCPKGEYQDLPGKTKCKRCPATTSTLGVGSTVAADCIAGPSPIDSSHQGKEKETSQGEVGVHVAIGVSISAAVIGLTVIIVALACKHFYKRKMQVNDSFISLQQPYISPPPYSANIETEPCKAI